MTQKVSLTRNDRPKTSRALLAKCRFGVTLLITGFGACVLPDAAWALQSHGPPEGLFAHQIGHILFGLSMAILAYWLESNRFTTKKGWRLIQVSCLLFLLWNVVAFFGHYVEGRISSELIVGQQGSWNQRLLATGGPLGACYYTLKLDHLVCVPAIVCLFLGIRDLYRLTLEEAARGK